MSEDSTARVGMKQIADSLGVSIGTVDRALNGKKGVSPITRVKVLNMARDLGYRPNLAARFLSGKKQLRIAVNLPAEIALFFDDVRSGVIDQATTLEATGTKVVFHTYPRIGEGEREAFEAALEEGADGIIVNPGDPAELRGLIRKAAQRNVPVMCVVTDAPGTERLAAVWADPYISGAVVAELLGRFLKDSGSVLLVTGFLKTVDHAEKVRGFRESLEKLSPGLRIADIVEAHEDEREAFAKCRDAILDTPDLRSIYVTTVNSMPVLRAVEECGLAGKLEVVTTDLFPGLIERIRSGVVSATMHQRPFQQGRIALQTIHRFLVEGASPPPLIRLAPHVVLRSNLDFFLRRHGTEREAHAQPAARTLMQRA